MGSGLFLPLIFFFFKEKEEECGYKVLSAHDMG
jgi:hypothetical protein